MIFGGSAYRVVYEFDPKDVWILTPTENEIGQARGSSGKLKLSSLCPVQFLLAVDSLEVTRRVYQDSGPVNEATSLASSHALLVATQFAVSGRKCQCENVDFKLYVV